MRTGVVVWFVALTACSAGSVVGPAGELVEQPSGDHDGGGDDGSAVITDSDTPTDTDPPDDACPPPIVHQATGATRQLAPGGTLAAVLAQSAPGDRVVISGGVHASEQITASFASDVFVEAADGTTPLFHGLSFVQSSHVVLRGLSFDDTLTLQASHHFTLEEVSIDLGTQDKSGLVIDGQHSGGACHDIVVSSSTIGGGARTIFLLGMFASADTWNHDILVARSDLACGSHNCFQLSGARDMQIVDNVFHDPKGAAVLTAGATRITIARNRMLGDPAVDATAIQLATPGEWDPYTGNQYMISSDIVVADNLIVDWGGPGISLHAATRIDIVNNTVDTNVGLSTWHRVPHDTGGNVILSGNSEIRLWNNILTTIQLDAADPRPTFESHNLVRTGGAGDALITTAPAFADTSTYALASDSPAVNSGLADADTPEEDLLGHARNGVPDRGAVEYGGAAPACP